MVRFRLGYAKGLAVLLWALFVCQPMYAEGARPVATSKAASPPPTLVFGFLGGFVHHDDGRHPAVKFVQRLREEHPKDIEAAVFENRRYRDVYKIIRERLDTDHDGRLSDAEKQPARILLFGNSWGGSAVVALARRLNRDGIPVVLTVQVDSVAKLGDNDSLIPPNVRQAVNYYQTHGWVHGQRKIVAADPSRTKILGNFLLSYDKNPIQCEGLPWYDNLVMKTHIATECDPQVWSEIESLVQRELPGTSNQPAESTPPVGTVESSATARN
jgi:hypothetical protein